MIMKKKIIIIYLLIVKIQIIHFTKSKTIKNYITKKNRIIKSIKLKNIKNNNTYNSSKNIFKRPDETINTHQNIYSYNTKDINNNNIINKRIFIKKSNRNILLTSLFNLPQIPQKSNNHNHSQKNIKNKSEILLISKNNIENPKLNDKTSKSQNKLISTIEEKEILKLENYMRDKFYEDIEKKMAVKLKEKNFCHDTSMKEKIIKMNKIGLFWGTVFEYCNPVLSVKKLKYAKNLFLKNKKIETDDIGINEYKHKKNKEIKPILYTNSFVNQLKHSDKFKNIRNLSTNK